MSVKQKFCFATEVTYPNYTKRVKLNILSDFFKFELDKKGFVYFIATNRPQDFEEYKDHASVKIFHIEDLRKDVPESAVHELYPEDPRGLYPSKYPWNMRRFLLKKAAEEGYSGCLYIDADLKVMQHMDADSLYNSLVNVYESNVVGTNSAIFFYANKTPDDVFNHHDAHISHFNLQFQPEQYNTLDGPVQFFMGATPADLMNMYEKWNFFALFGYKKEHGFGYGNNKHGNLSFAIPSAGFTLKFISLPIYPAHCQEDRY
jgi:hypothetical protein